MSRIAQAVLLLSLPALLLAGAARATIHDITIGNNFFSPLGATIQHGDTVRWTWVGGVPHSTTSDASSAKTWDSGVTSLGGNTFLLEFTAADGPGPFPYHCAIHAGMKDTIFVQAVGTCCLPPTVGDVNQSGIVDITDISVMIDNQFLTLTPLVCLAEGDIDFSGITDITDLSILIDNQFLTLTPLPPCP